MFHFVIKSAFVVLAFIVLSCMSNVNFADAASERPNVKEFTFGSSYKDVLEIMKKYKGSLQNGGAAWPRLLPTKENFDGHLEDSRDAKRITKCEGIVNKRELANIRFLFVDDKLVQIFYDIEGNGVNEILPALEKAYPDGRSIFKNPEYKSRGCFVAKTDKYNVIFDWALDMMGRRHPVIYSSLQADDLLKSACEDAKKEKEMSNQKKLDELSKGL